MKPVEVLLQQSMLYQKYGNCHNNLDREITNLRKAYQDER